MEQYISKSALVAEIKRIEHETNYEPFTDEVLGKRCVCRSLLSFTDTLEVKEVDLEEKATQLSLKYFPNEENIWARPNLEAQECKRACIEMVEWLKAQKGEEV